MGDLKIDSETNFIWKYKVWMGVKGLYSCLKPYSFPVKLQDVSPQRIALDAYPFLYKYKQDISSCIQLFQSIVAAGHQCQLFVDGNPPKEKLEELASRKQQREEAYRKAKALKEVLENEETASQLDESAKQVLEKQIQMYLVESYSIKKEIREEFLRRVKEETSIPVIMCEGEADNCLIEASLKGTVDIVIANDMDLFVGGVERLWILGKTQADPLFLEFQRSVISKKVGIHPHFWTDVALLAGYEKTPELKRCSVQQAIIWIRYYGSLENLLSRRLELLQGEKVETFIHARKFFLV
jgi:5'-3' exonuclease